MIASIAYRFVARKLDTSVGVSGPHDLAVHEDAFVGALIARVSLPTSTASRRLTSVTIAIRPSSGGGTARG